MVYVIACIHLSGKDDRRMVNLMVIMVGYLLTPGIVGIEMTELDIKYGCAYLVHPAVDTFIVKYVFTCRTVVGEASYCICQLGVVGGDGTCIGKCAEILARIKTMTGGISQTAGEMGAETAALRLRIIFNQLEVMTPADAADSIGIGASAIEVHQQKCTGAGGDVRFDEACVNLQRIVFWFYEDGFQTIAGDGKDGGDKGIGGNEDFIPFCHHAHLDISTENQRQRIQSVACSYTMVGTYIFCIIGFETLGLFAQQIPA